ncbi:MAG: putative transport system ATP-binding protein [Actinomycetota bacterium]|jgi:putative ABC transport system ATP-binding protein
MYELHDVVKSYGDGAAALRAVDGISLKIDAGEFVVIEGPSGSGKSTLLQMLGALDRPSAGSVLFEGDDLATMRDSKLATLRLRTFGFVFQQFNLIPTLSAVENVESALAPLGGSRRKKHERALRLLNGVGLSDRADHLPSMLSGGEQQRVAIARALSKGPRVILADEPTGNLDTRTGSEIMAILRRLSKENGQTVVLITHDPEIAARAPRVVRVRDGRVVADASGKELIEAAAAMPARLTLPPITTDPQPNSELGAPSPEKRDSTRPVPESAADKWVPTANTPRWTTDPLLHAEGVVKHYVSIESEDDVVGIDGVSLIVHEGEFVAITGPSGSGKTTLLNCLSGLDRIDRGRVLICGQTVHDLSDKQQSHLRSEVMGFIFQNWNLVPVFSAVENVELPLLLNGVKPDEARKQAITTLERIGLGHRVHHHPNALSGGEQQRVAIARALSASPALVWADEPTGNLDSATAESVMKLLRELNDDGLAIVLVTHDESIAEQATRRLYIRDGKLLADMTRRDAIRGQNREMQRPAPQTQQAPAAPRAHEAPKQELDLREEAPAPAEAPKAPMGKAARRAARREARMNMQPRQDPSPQASPPRTPSPQPRSDGPQPITYDNPFE